MVVHSFCVCLCICLVPALTFESLDLETLFFICRYILRISRLGSYIKVKVTGTERSYKCNKMCKCTHLRVVQLHLNSYVVLRHSCN